MTNMTPTSRERQFLRAIAAVNPSPLRPGESDWWSPYELRHTPLFPDFRQATVMVIAGFGKSCCRKGMAVSRYIGTRGHGWAEWRISAFGRGLVSDSCIGGGLPWDETGPGPVCRACREPMTGIGVGAMNPPEAPAHPLPGHTTTAPGETR